jgi:hypothetical protein
VVACAIVHVDANIDPIETGIEPQFDARGKRHGAVRDGAAVRP